MFANKYLTLFHSKMHHKHCNNTRNSCNFLLQLCNYLKQKIQLNKFLEQYGLAFKMMNYHGYSKEQTRTIETYFK